MIFFLTVVSFPPKQSWFSYTGASKIALNIVYHIYQSVSLKCACFFLFTDSNFVLGNAQAAGYPIVYCSDGFCELTGCSRAQVMSKGCACKFLYGAETSQEEIEKIENALETHTELKTDVLFYRKEGRGKPSKYEGQSIKLTPHFTDTSNHN